MAKENETKKLTMEINKNEGRYHVNLSFPDNLEVDDIMEGIYSLLSLAKDKFSLDYRQYNENMFAMGFSLYEDDERIEELIRK